MELQGIRQTLAELRNSQQEIKRLASASATASERIARADDKATDSVERGARRRKRSYQETGRSARKAAQEMEEAAGRADRASRQMDRDQIRAHARGGAGLAGGLVSTFVGGLGGGIPGLNAAEAASAALRGVQSSLQNFEAKQSMVDVADLRYGGGSGEVLDARLYGLADELGASIGTLRQSAMMLFNSSERDEIVPILKGFLAMNPGATSVQQQSALLQFAQTLSGGRLQGDELRIINEAGFTKLEQAIKDAGMGDRIRDSANPITAEELKAIAKAYGESEEGMKAILIQAERASAAWERAGNAWSQTSETVGEGLQPTSNFFAQVSEGIAQMLSGFLASPELLVASMHPVLAILARIEAHRRGRADFESRVASSKSVLQPGQSPSARFNPQDAGYSGAAGGAPQAANQAVQTGAPAKGKSSSPNNSIFDPSYGAPVRPGNVSNRYADVQNAWAEGGSVGRQVSGE